MQSERTPGAAQDAHFVALLFLAPVVSIVALLTSLRERRLPRLAELRRRLRDVQARRRNP